MSSNRELARQFEQMSELLAITGANTFRVNAHSRVARVLQDLSTDVAELADDPKKLTAIDGIGEGSAEKIIEYLETGKIAEHEQMLDQVPAGLLDVLELPGVGPKTARLLWEKADVTDLDTLKKKLETGELENLPRIGKKTLENIKDSIAFTATAAERTRIGVAMPLAEAIVEFVKGVDGTQQTDYAGSLRRGKETIGDIDILAATTNPKKLADAFTKMDGVTKVLGKGEAKCAVRLEQGIQCDLRLVDASYFGAALMYFTGSKEHNVRMRERAIKMGYRLNEYGLFKDDGDDTPPQQRGRKPVVAKTEQGIYKRLDLPWIAPELREDRGEFDADLPDLIDPDDIKCELHAHTTASDGHWSIEDLASEAKRRGFHTVAVTDHSKASAQANGLNVDRLLEHIEAVRNVDQQIKGIKVLAGSEVDILGDGKLDYDDDVLAELDIVVASPHVALSQDSKKATKRLIKAIENPYVHILGHPTGRLIGKRQGNNPDINAIIEAAIENEVALEINANDLRLDLRDTHVKAAVDAGALLAINTDAHHRDHMDLLRYGVLTARRGWLTAEQCINTWSKQKLSKWLNSKR